MLNEGRVVAHSARSTIGWAARAAWLEPFWVLALAPALLLPQRFLPEVLRPYPADLRPWLIALLFLWWPLRALAYGRLSRRTPLDWPLGLLGLWLPVTFLVSPDRAAALEALGYLAYALAVYFALLNWPPAERRPELIAWGLLVAGGGLALVTPFLSALNGIKLFSLPRVFPALASIADALPGNVNGNRIAGALVVVLPLYAALALWGAWTRRPALRVTCFAGALLIGAVVVLTQSRSAYMAGAAALGLVLLVRWPRLAYALPLVALAGGLAIAHPAVQASFGSMDTGTVLRGWDGRMELWSRAIYALGDAPFTGIGIGAFSHVIPRLYPLFLGDPDQITHVHNLALQVGIDLGLPGLVACSALVLGVFALLAQTIFRRRAEPLAAALAAGTAGGLLAVLVHGIFDAALWGVRPAVLPWLLVALAVQLGLQPARAAE